MPLSGTVPPDGMINLITHSMNVALAAAGNAEPGFPLPRLPPARYRRAWLRSTCSTTCRKSTGHGVPTAFLTQKPTF